MEFFIGLNRMLHPWFDICHITTAYFCDLSIKNQYPIAIYKGQNLTSMCMLVIRGMLARLYSKMLG